jgi:hypothetical protein
MRRKRINVAKPDIRAGSKTTKILGLLKRPGGAAAKELTKATGWQPYSVRGLRAILEIAFCPYSFQTPNLQ